MNILIDMDQVLVDFITPLLNKYNQNYKTNITHNDIKEYDLSKIMNITQAKKIWNTRRFFLSLNPYPNAIEVMERLNKKHNLVIATKPGNINNMIEKAKWIEYNLPFIPFENITMTSYKYTMDFDIILDDNPEYLQKFRRLKIVYDQPYNQDCSCDFRVYDWLDFERKINYISQYYELTNRVK